MSQSSTPLNLTSDEAATRDIRGGQPTFARQARKEYLGVMHGLKEKDGTEDDR